jgi:hypothetical protein
MIHSDKKRQLIRLVVLYGIAIFSASFYLVFVKLMYWGLSLTENEKNFMMPGLFLVRPIFPGGPHYSFLFFPGVVLFNAIAYLCFLLLIVAVVSFLKSHLLGLIGRNESDQS